MAQVSLLCCSVATTLDWLFGDARGRVWRCYLRLVWVDILPTTADADSDIYVLYSFSDSLHYVNFYYKVLLSYQAISTDVGGPLTIDGALFANMCTVVVKRQDIKTNGLRDVLLYEAVYEQLWLKLSIFVESKRKPGHSNSRLTLVAECICLLSANRLGKKIDMWFTCFVLFFFDVIFVILLSFSYVLVPPTMTKVSLSIQESTTRSVLNLDKTATC